MSERGERWVAVPLENLGQLHCGQSPTSAAVNSDREGTPYVSGPEQWDGHSLHLNKWTTEPKRTVGEGCIFITVKGAGVGKTFPGTACAIGRDIYAFEPSRELDKQFVFWGIINTIEELKRHALGDIPGLSKGHILQHRVNVPPLPEQHRIVGAIESYLTRLDDAVASLERVQKNLKRYRASVLRAAVEGRLVPTEAELARKEGREYEPASVLLERILKERRRRWEEGELAKMKAKGKVPKNDKWKQKYKEPLAPDTSDLPDLPEGWCWASLSQTCVLERGRFSIRPRNDPRYYGGQFPFVQIGDLPREGGRIRAYGSTLNEKGLSVSREFPPGTVLIAIVGATIANTGVLAFAACCPDSLVAAQPIEDLNGDYLDYFLRQNKMLLRGLGYASGGQPNINLGVLNPFPMPLPPREEQRRIGVEVGRHLSIIDHAEDLAAGNTQKAGRLRQSILKWAFEGKLVDQDPTDEPASVFLERIKAERAALETQKKANKKKTSRRKK